MLVQTPQALLPGARVTKKDYSERYCEPTMWDDMVRGLIYHSELNRSELS